MTNDTTKHCSKCLKVLPATSEYFSADKRNSSGFQSQCRTCRYDYRVAHRKEEASYKASYYIAHRAEILARMSSYKKNHRAKIASYNASYRVTHRKEITAQRKTYSSKHRVERGEYNAEWSKANPDKIRAIKHRRRALKVGNGGTHTDTDIQRQGKCQKWKCWWCGKDCKDKYHVDHIIPLMKGGHNNPSNLVISCPNCNLSKHDKLPDEFTGKLF